MHIGLIGGIGPAATEFYYRKLAKAHADAGVVMDLTIVHADLHTLAANMGAGEAEAQAREYRRLTERLQAAGAEAVAITSIGGHFCAPEFEAISPLPVLSVIPAVAAEVARCGYRRVGILGTRVAMETRIYGGLSDVETVVPQGKAFEQTHDDYIGLAMAARASEGQRQRLFNAGRALYKTQGAEAVILGGTDLFLAFEGHDPGFPVIDGAEAHVAALFKASVEGLAAYPAAG